MPSKPHIPTDKTRAEIVALRSYGVPIKEVAFYIGIDDVIQPSVFGLPLSAIYVLSLQL